MNHQEGFALRLRRMGLVIVLMGIVACGLRAQQGSIGATWTNGAETYRGYQGPSNEPGAQPDWLWTIQRDINATAAANSGGMAGAQFIKNTQIPNGEFWTTMWATDTLVRWDAAGGFLGKFSIPGLSGVRALTFDGTYLYAATNATTLYRINPVTRALAPPHVNSSSLSNARHASYDPTLNSNAGGFWIGNFATDIDAISMSGAVLSSIPAATHGLTAMYGSAYDPYSTGGPYLWIFNQGGTNDSQIERINLATGMTAPSYSHDVLPDFHISNGLASGLAGGLFISDQLVNGKKTIGGILQGVPNNVLFAYELADEALASADPVSDVHITSQNPSTGKFVLSFNDAVNAKLEVKVTNIVGQEMRSYSVNPRIEPSFEIDLMGEATGVYFVRINHKGVSTVLKAVVVR